MLLSSVMHPKRKAAIISSRQNRAHRRILYGRGNRRRERRGEAICINRGRLRRRCGHRTRTIIIGAFLRCRRDTRDVDNARRGPGAFRRQRHTLFRDIVDTAEHDTWNINEQFLSRSQDRGQSRLNTS